MQTTLLATQLVDLNSQCLLCHISVDLVLHQRKAHQIVLHAFKFRSPDEHKRMCSEVNADPTNKKSTEYGINERSVLNDVYGFSVMVGLCHDVFHDLLEGSIVCIAIVRPYIY